MRMTKPAQKRAFWGWAWWAPPILFAVGVAAFHAWTSIQIRKNDYEVAKYRREMEALTAEMRDVKVQMAEREEMTTVSTNASELGLREPRPDQIVRLAFNPDQYKPVDAPVDASATPEAATPDAPRRKAEPAIEMAQTQPQAAVVPRETGRLTMALDLDAALVPVNTAAPASSDAPANMDKSVEDMLGSF